MLTQNPAIAEEVLQEALTQLWASSKTPSEETEFRRWLYRAVASRATDYHRRQALARRIRFWAPAPPDPMVEIDRRAGDEEMGRLLRPLSPRQRQADPPANLAGTLMARASEGRRPARLIYSFAMAAGVVATVALVALGAWQLRYGKVPSPVATPLIGLSPTATPTPSASPTPTAT